MDRVSRVRLKIKRAEKHIDDLEIAIQRFIDSKPYKIGAKPHPVVAIEHTTLFIEEVKPVPNDIALILGDAIHNLRSALDHLAWQLVEAGGGTPSKETYFPICETPQQYASALGKGEIKRMRTGAEKVLSSVQPHQTSDQTLWLLHQLDIVDKHRLLLTIGAFMDKWGVDFAVGKTMWLSDHRFVPLVAGNDITNILTSTYNKHLPEQFALGLDMAFGEPEVAEGDLVLQTVKKLLAFVNGLVSRFQQFLV